GVCGDICGAVLSFFGELRRKIVIKHSNYKMNTRNKVRRATTSEVVTQRLVTKKEMESMNSKPCPSKPQRGYVLAEDLKRKIYSKGNGAAKAINFTRPTFLSSCYDSKSKVSYLGQLFMVCECIGEGSFGVVYKAFNREDRLSYAIKLVKKHTSEAANYDEIRCLEKIGEHENLVTFYLAWEEKNIIYMQLELCALSLATYTKTNHKLVNSQLWDIFTDMLYAIQHLHRNSLVHLDIKPDNIMMSEDGRYKLGDFGLLMNLNEAPASLALKAAHTSEGDAKYLAKEVLEGVYSRAADIFSLGISMLELASDVILPGNGPLWHSLRDGTFCSEYFRLVPSRLRSVITKMMVPYSEDRPVVDTILGFNSIKKATEERHQKSRTNYYAIWRSQNIDEEVQPIAVCLNPRNTPPREENSDDEGMGVEPLNASACVTPPKCVSQVILYTI
ncbi:protein kinase, partial [Oryctes borbonicus]